LKYKTLSVSKMQRHTTTLLLFKIQDSMAAILEYELPKPFSAKRKTKKYTPLISSVCYVSLWAFYILQLMPHLN